MYVEFAGECLVVTMEDGDLINDIVVGIFDRCGNDDLFSNTEESYILEYTAA